jgi:hypothetical protein
VTITVCTSGCFLPHSKAYAPEDEAERKLFTQARRDVYPDDVRANPANYQSETLLWTGIVTDVAVVEPRKYRLVVEHHYWDWIEDYSIQREVAFLSPRGEGRFECRFTAKSDVLPEQIARLADMAIVYGTPQQVDDSGTIIMICPYYKTLRRELYGTDIFDYGRNGSDLKWLRVPGIDDVRKP